MHRSEIVGQAFAVGGISVVFLALAGGCIVMLGWSTSSIISAVSMLAIGGTWMRLMLQR